jgi:hypothetical protein
VIDELSEMIGWDEGRGRLQLDDPTFGKAKFRRGGWATDRLRTAIMEAMTPAQTQSMREAFRIPK